MATVQCDGCGKYSDFVYCERCFDAQKQDAEVASDKCLGLHEEIQALEEELKELKEKYAAIRKMCLACNTCAALMAAEQL